MKTDKKKVDQALVTLLDRWKVDTSQRAPTQLTALSRRHKMSGRDAGRSKNRNDLRKMLQDCNFRQKGLAVLEFSRPAHLAALLAAALQDLVV